MDYIVSFKNMDIKNKVSNDKAKYYLISRMKIKLHYYLHTEIYIQKQHKILNKASRVS